MRRSQSTVRGRRRPASSTGLQRALAGMALQGAAAQAANPAAMAATRFDVVGIGNAIVDVIATADEAFLAAHGMTKGAMMLVDEAQATAIYEAMGATVTTSGGSAGNTIAGFASFGARAAYIGKVRDDVFGQAFRHDITALGVHFPTPPAVDGAATACCLIPGYPRLRAHDEHVPRSVRVTDWSGRRRRGAGARCSDRLSRGLSLRRTACQASLRAFR